MMETAPIESSTIQTIGYKDDTLFIRFHSGTVYSYSNCGYHFFDALRKAESAGSFFHRWVRSKFKYTRLEQDPFVNL